MAKSKNAEFALHGLWFKVEEELLLWFDGI
jgi:hypothetical protein